MKKNTVLIVASFFLVLLSSCLTLTEKKTLLPPPYRPAVSENAQLVDAPDGQIAPVYYSSKESPVIDGVFDEWEGLEGVRTQTMVYGGLFDEEDTDGTFVVWATDDALYLFANVIDNDPNTNDLPGPQAWRGDSIEFFFGTDAMHHTFYKNTDRRVRVASRDKEDIFACTISINDVEIRSTEVAAACVFSESGYKIEARFPFSLMNISKLKVGQKVRLEFQINDADDGKERTRLVHWMSSKDASYIDASTWGNGRVVALPETRGGNQ